MINGHNSPPPCDFASHYQSAIDAALVNGHTFILGDAVGVDSQALAYLLSKGCLKSRISIHASLPANAKRLREAEFPHVIFELQKEKGDRGRARHLERDARMTRASDYNILWVRSEEEGRTLHGERYRARVSATQMNKERKDQVERERASLQQTPRAMGSPQNLR
jgi:hypothetical protein